MKKKIDRSPDKKSEALDGLNIQGYDQLSQLRLSTKKMAQLLSMVETDRKKYSPIPDFIEPVPANLGFIKEMIERKWIGSDDSDKTPELDPVANDVLASLLAPNTSVHIILGSIKEMIFTELYSKTGFHDHELAIYTYREEEDLHVITPGQSPSDISDALLAHLLNGPVSEGMNFEIHLKEAEFLGYLAVLDFIYARQLEAKLQADGYPALTFSIDDVWQRFAKLRSGEDLLWCSVLLPFLFPYLQIELTLEEAEKIIPKLAGEGLITSTVDEFYQPTDFTIALAESIMPIISFASCAVLTTGDEGMHMGFIIGLNVNLVVQSFPDGDENTYVLMGMDSLRLSRLLFEIGVPVDITEEEAKSKK